MNKQKAIVCWVIFLTLITLGTSALTAKNYYDFKRNVAHEHREFRLTAGEIRYATVANCEEIELVKTALRATIEQAQQFLKTSPVRSPEEKKQGEEYYKKALANFKVKDCRKEGASFSKNSSRNSRKTVRPSRSGSHQRHTSSSAPGSSRSSTDRTTP